MFDLIRSFEIPNDGMVFSADPPCVRWTSLYLWWAHVELHMDLHGMH